MNDFLEQTLEQIIFDNRETIHERGFPKFLKNSLKQLILPSGKKIDILTFGISENIIEFSVIELKKDQTDEATLIQAYNYAFELTALLENHFILRIPKIILVGSSIRPIQIINDLAVPVELYTWNYRYDGLHFKRIEKPTTDFEGDKLFSDALYAMNFEMVDENNRFLENYKIGCAEVKNYSIILECCKLLNKPFNETMDIMVARYGPNPPFVNIHDLIK